MNPDQLMGWPGRRPGKRPERDRPMSAPASPDAVRVEFQWLDGDDIGVVVRHDGREHAVILERDRLKRREPIPPIVLPSRDLKTVPNLDIKASDQG